MYLKVPVIASSVGGLMEVLRNKEDSLLVEPGNTKELAAAIRYLHDHEIERKQLAENAFEKVCRRFTVADMAREYVDMFLQDFSGLSQKEASKADWTCSRQGNGGKMSHR